MSYKPPPRQSWHPGRDFYSTVVRGDEKEATQMLRVARALVDTRIDSGRTPIMAAIQLGHTQILHKLLDCGADLSCKTVDGDGLLHLAACVGDVNTIEILASHGLEINATGARGHSPLACAVFYGHYSATKRLLELGADPNQGDYQCKTPLCAVESTAIHGQEKLPAVKAAIRELLKQYGATRGFAPPPSRQQNAWWF